MLQRLSWFLALSVAFSVAEDEICSYSNSSVMTSADCSGRMLENIPTSLNSNILVLIASHNRIREVYKDSFKRYTYLKYLYMDHNMISYVEKGTFDVLQNLEVIHLSHNALETVPAGVLRLPKLRKLFVNNNRLTDGGCFARVPPSETLESLSLANCNLVDLPPLDKYPNLLELNVSGNKLKSISPQQLAPMCRLYLLDLRANPMLFKDSEACECHLLAAWMKQMSIYFAEMPLDCSGETASQANGRSVCTSHTPEVTETQRPCTAATVRGEQNLNIWLAWILPSVFVLACLLIVFILLSTKLQAEVEQRREDTDTDF